MLSWNLDARDTRQLSRHEAVAKAINDFPNDREGFTAFLADGRIGSTNNSAERKLRAVARNRKAWLFGTALFNDVDPLRLVH